MDDYSAYYRRVRQSLDAFVGDQDSEGDYPEPKAHCDICRWQGDCEARRRADDHLCLVAGMSKLHITELRQWGINTATELAAMPVPLAWKPERGSAHAYERIREQARIQIEDRTAGQILHELLPVVPGFGLSIPPAPSPGDVFFDLEGDPVAGDGGLEYLFAMRSPAPMARSLTQPTGFSPVRTKSSRSSGLSILSPNDLGGFRTCASIILRPMSPPR